MKIICHNSVAVIIIPATMITTDQVQVILNSVLETVTATALVSLMVLILDLDMDMVASTVTDTAQVYNVCV